MDAKIKVQLMFGRYILPTYKENKLVSKEVGTKLRETVWVSNN